MDTNGFHHLAAPAISFDKNKIIPKGSPCIGYDFGYPSVYFLSEDITVGSLKNYIDKDYTIEDIITLINKNLTFNFNYARYMMRVGQPDALECLEPSSKDDFASFMPGYNPTKESNSLPWNNINQ